MKKSLMLLLIGIVSFICFKGKVVDVTAEMSEVDITSPSAIVIEAETGQVLFAKAANSRRAPASMTKIMTLKLILDALVSQRIKYDQLVTTSEHAASMGGSQIFLSVNEQMKVEDMLKSVAIASANDAAVALAEQISGSEKNFIQMMNTECQKLGLHDTNFNNATGLTTNNHYSSCYDMAMIARSLINEHDEQILKLTSIYEDYIRQDTDKPFWLVNTNKLVKFVPGIDGLKTGWTEEAGYCLTSTMKKEEMRVIVVVMGSESVKVRTADTLALLNHTFANYTKTKLYAKGTVIESIDNILISPSKLNIVTEKDVVAIHQQNESPSYRYETKINYERIQKGVIGSVGSLSVYQDDQLIYTVNLVLDVVPAKASYWQLLGSILAQLLT